MSAAAVARGDTPPRGDRVKVDERAAPPPKPARVTTELDSSYAQALRIARLLHDDRTVARLLVLHGLDRNAKEGDLLAVLEAYEASGKPDAAVSFLRERIKRYPDEKRPRVLLAEFLTRSGDTRAAIGAWKEQLARFGDDALTPDETHKYARDLSRAGEVDAAYDVLLALRHRAPDDAKEYWLDLATLAWDRDDDPTALAAYQRVYELDPATPHVAPRLIALHADSGRLDDATLLALADYARADDPASVLVVAHLREQRGEWKRLKELMDAADGKKGSLLQREDWLLLEGDCLKELGEPRAAIEAYRRVLAVAPRSVAAKANILWTAMERDDTAARAQLRDAIAAFAAASRDEPTLWAPVALGLAKLGRHEQSLPYFERHLARSPEDSHVLLDFSEVLTKLGRHGLGSELRRRAVARLRLDAVKALHAKARTEQDLLVIESTQAEVREHSGAPQGDKWLQAIVSANPRFRRQEEVAVDAYLATERPDFARRILLGMGNAGREGALRRHRLALAVAEEDHAEIAALLEGQSDLTGEERAHALVALGREREAIGAIGEELAREAPAPQSSGLREELTRIAPSHRPTLRAGGWYAHVTGLDVAGPIVGASHDFGHGALVYSAYGVQMAERAALIAVPSPRYEADAGVLYRVPGARGVTEAGAWLDYQPGRPVGRATFFDQRLVTSRLGVTSEARIGSRIDDTSFLRVAGVRNVVSVGARYDARRWYAALDLDGREDQTRAYEHLAWDAVEAAEAGVKIVAGEPELAVGAQAQASQRVNRDRLPDDVSGLILPRVDRSRALPPTFQLLGGVVHLSRGDYHDRYRPDRAPFPRYDCEAALGVLLPDADAAVHVQCGASVRAPRGSASVYAFYNRGVAGVTNNENAELSLSYAIAF